MKPLFQDLFPLAAAMALASCTSYSSPGGGAVGPYDSRGNYVEAWADDPSKWKYPAKDIEALAVNDVPPPHMTPLAPGGPDILLPSMSGTSRPSSTSRPPSSSTLPKSTKTSVAKATPSKSTKSSVAKNTRSSKPKVSAPKTVRHLVKRGDTLGGLAAKYGTTVSAIQKANGIKGTLIYDGKSLTIPPRRK